MNTTTVLYAMSATLSLQARLNRLATWVQLALGHLPGPNHSCQAWFEEQLGGQLMPLHDLLTKAVMTRQQPYVPPVLLSGVMEFGHTGQYGVLA
ncbi:hypothetical protein AcW1_002462 [Taiwanofungus camphoratus]|nr:hypothetical protein AcW1_002462 [Antrodia cinnamomea]